MVEVRGWWMLGLGLGLVAGGSCGPDAFACSDDAACKGTVEGQCISGYCAFPDDDCDSGLKYGDAAGRLSDTCVPADAASVGEGTGSGPGPGSGVDAATAADAESGATGTDSGEPGGPVEFRDDAFPDEFEAGTFDQTQWADGRLGLSPGAGEGTFTSRVFDAGAAAQWQTVQWEPEGPYAKPLPDGGAAERGYPQGGLDMGGNVLLMHFEGRGVWGDGVAVLDASGAQSHGTVISEGGPVALVEGVLGTAIDDHVASRISIPTDRAPGLTLGEEDFSWALWFRMDDPCVENHVYMGVDNAEGTDYGPHLWLGCTDDAWDECPGTVSRPRVGGVLHSEHTTGDGGFYCSSREIDDDRWHHVVVTKQGHADAELRLYVDGQLEYQGAASFASPLEYPDAPDFTIGAFSRGTYPAVGVFDEAAVWTRALDADEVAAAYRRGALRLSLSLRTCTEPDCADAPPFGAPLLDPASALGPQSVLPLEGLPPGRYVQYRVQLSRLDADDDPSPQLRAVTVRGML